MSRTMVKHSNWRDKLEGSWEDRIVLLVDNKSSIDLAKHQDVAHEWSEAHRNKVSLSKGSIKQGEIGDAILQDRFETCRFANKAFKY